MIRFSSDMVKQLHLMMAEATGGSVGLRDEGLLDSALESAFATFDGIELYPTTEEKAARLAFSLVSNHAFVDGNKRVGVFVMLCFLELNGIRINAESEDVIRLGLGVADGSMKYEEILSWIRERTE